MSAYVVVHVEVTDPEKYPEYARQTMATAAPYGGEFLAKGGAQSVWEGTAKPRTVLIAFPNVAQAEAWFTSSEYAAIKPLGVATSKRDILVVEGV